MFLHHFSELWYKKLKKCKENTFHMQFCNESMCCVRNYVGGSADGLFASIREKENVYGG